MKFLLVLALGLALAACEGHSYEPTDPGIQMSGEAGIGMKYSDGKVSPATKTKVTVSIGGSI